MASTSVVRSGLGVLGFRELVRVEGFSSHLTGQYLVHLVLLQLFGQHSNFETKTGITATARVEDSGTSNFLSKVQMYCLLEILAEAGT